MLPKYLSICTYLYLSVPYLHVPLYLYWKVLRFTVYLRYVDCDILDTLDRYVGR